MSPRLRAEGPAVPIVILWAEAAVPFAAAVHRWLANMARSTFLLDKWLKARVEQVRQLERRTAGFPIFFYYNTALTARVVDVQAGSLLTVPVMGVGAHVERALEQWNVARDVRNQARSAGLPIELLRVIEEMSLGILASLDRFEHPSTDMYDPGRRTASDLIGLAALAFRTVGANRDGLKATAERLTEAFRIGKHSEGAPESKTRSIDATPLPFDLRIDELNRYVVGALMVIPAVSALLQSLGGDALTALRYKALAKFEELEALAYASRRKMLVGFSGGMRAFAAAVLKFFARIGELATGHIEAFTAIATSMIRGVTDGVSAFVDQFETYWKAMIVLARRMLAFGIEIASIDVGEVIHLGLVTVEKAIDRLGFALYPVLDQPEEYEAPGQFPVTLGELALAEGAGARANSEIRTAIARLTAAVRGAMGFDTFNTIIYAETDGKVRLSIIMTGLDEMATALALPRAPLAGQPVLTADLSGVPDLVATVVHPLRTGLTDAIAKLAAGADSGIGAAAGSLQAGLGATARKFHNAAAKAAAAEPIPMLDGLTGGAIGVVSSSFGDPEGERRKSGLDPVAQAFAAWMQGGFDTIAKVASGYIRFILDEWLVHVAQGRDLPVQLTPTSPKRLLERAELGRVHMPRMRIVAMRREIGRPLAEQVADEFRGAVETAYRTGLGRMAEFAAVAV